MFFVPDSTKVLVVGAGGIGCELLKNLVLEDFRKITVIDLDTIDISNLNRQFLFQRIHVGKPKAEVARESVLKFRPSCDITAIHKSILSSAFNLEFFKSFDLVFNALDNRAARRHVNRLCVAAGCPLIESGTSGYLGQVEPFLPTGFRSKSSNGTFCEDDTHANTFQTGCYECQQRGTAQRTYPACTIRNTPSEPIHCVVWAKYLFNQLFGEPDVDDEDVSPDMNDPELHQTHGDVTGPHNGGTVTGGYSQANHGDQSRSSEALRKWFDKLLAEPQHTLSLGFPTAAMALAWRLFHQDIITLLGMKDLWIDRQDRRQPTPLDRDTLDSAAKNAPGIGESAVETFEKTLTSINHSELRDQRRLTKCDWLHLFLTSVDALHSRVQQAEHTTLTFDKDDSDAMDLVAAAAVLRAHLFHLPGAEDLTRFTVKSLAGNIVPAIATTNAIVAGLMVLQAKRVLSKSEKHIHTVYVQRIPVGRPGNRRLITSCTPAPRNPSCMVCSAEAMRPPLGLICFPNRLSLRVLRDNILIRHLGMLAPDVEWEDRGLILISSEEGETDEETLNKTLADFAVSDGVQLTCDDFRQDFRLRLVISTDIPTDAKSITNAPDSLDLFNDTEGCWRIVGDLNAWITAKSEGAPSANEEPRSRPARTSRDSDSDDDLLLIEPESQSNSADRLKRPRAPSPCLSGVESTVLGSSPCAIKRVRLDGSTNSSVKNHDDDDLICLD